MRPTQQRSAEVAVEAEGLALEAQRAEQADAEAGAYTRPLISST